MQFNLSQREISLKVVYYGPALSGKTTNLQHIHGVVDAESRGHLMVLNTRDDRTLFFDVMPVVVRTQSGFKVRLKLYTVPGQVIHDSTRRVVLQGADGVVFVADSQLSEARHNSLSYKNLRENLKANGIDEIPIVIQFNKRDLPNIRSDQELDTLAQRSIQPVYKAVAIRGDGVVETLSGLLEKLWTALDERHALSAKIGLSREEFLGVFFKTLQVDRKADPGKPPQNGRA